MSNTENLIDKEAIDKLKSLVDDIMICLFCTNVTTNDGASCCPMTAIKVCDQGNIWFFSEKNSDKNKAIATDKKVRLFFSHPGKNSYLVVNGVAEITFDKVIIEELWTPAAKIWFAEGKDDPTISVIKVRPTTAYYWDIDGNSMINFLKMVASVVTGDNLITGKEGTLTI
ncbi:MAG: general stress protein [Flavobacterium sp. BFFFF2]|nr:MAG: general stress protein [Flavobacterium sp. BFFFF2]